MPYARKPYYRRPYRRNYRRSFTLRRPKQPAISLRRYAPALNDQDTYFTIQSRQFTVSSDAAGLIAVSLPFSGVNANSNWTAYNLVFDEFRVDALEVIWTPSLPNSTTATFAPIHLVHDGDGGAAPTSVDTMLGYGSVKSFSMNQPWKYMTTITNDLQSRTAWYDVAAPTTQPDSVFMRSEGNSLSTQYATITIRYYVKFRSAR